MNEIEQLRADIKVMDSVSGEMKRLMTVRQYDQFTEINHAAHERLAKLEAEAAAKADLWARGKYLVEMWLTHGVTEPQDTVARYARHLQNRIAELEAELARTKEAHETVGEAYDCKREDNKDLRRTVKELEAELAKRPVVWCLRNKETGEYKKFSPTSGIALYSNANFATFSDWKFEPYTGEQS